MIRVLFILVFLSSITRADSFFTPGYNLGDTDKAAHFIAGACVSLGVNYLLYRYAPEISPVPRALAGWLAAFLVGVGKEVVDGRVDLKDIHATQLGGMASGLVVLPLELF